MRAQVSLWGNRTETEITVSSKKELTEITVRHFLRHLTSQKKNEIILSYLHEIRALKSISCLLLNKDGRQYKPINVYINCSSNKYLFRT